jgi:SagB-type dehydrogenase family enzyme
MIELPELSPSQATLFDVLRSRRSRRTFSGEPLTPGELGLLLWAAHGITGPDGRRTVPSAGHTDPQEVLAVTPEGTYRYLADEHRLETRFAGDQRPALAAAARGDERFLKAGAILAIVADPERTALRYGPRTARYQAMGAGHTAQNVLLQAEALGLSAFPVGAFDDALVLEVLELDETLLPLYLLPIGRAV